MMHILSAYTESTFITKSQTGEKISFIMISVDNDGKPIITEAPYSDELYESWKHPKDA